MSIKSSIILRPILSEKRTMLSDSLNKYVFQVEKTSNKLEIKNAVEKKFNVRIKKVSTMNFKGKNKNVTIKSSGHVLRTSGNRSSWKKAIVTLEEGFKIDMLGGEV
jgi:large subunit ribosomal protein L23